MTSEQLLDRIRPLEHRLDNGLRLLVREDHSTPVVAIVTYVRAGYFDEPDDLVGISHVLEHMFFKGTQRRGVGEIARATKAAGGYLNAGTIYDHTSYYTVLPSAAVDMGLDIQADALINSSIDEAELDKELGVIIEEVKRKLDNPSAMATETLFETMFDVHPIRRWRMGTEEGLRRLGREEVVGYYRRMYTGGTITLVVSGDVDPQHVVERVEALYAQLASGQPERPDHGSEPEQQEPRFREMSGDIAHTYAEIGWRTPGALHRDTPALDALGMVLGRGRASRLYRGVRDRGLASDIGAYNYTPDDLGVMQVGLECEPDLAADALRATWSEVDRLASGGVRPDELERVRTLMETRLLRRLETAEGQANLLAEWEALGDWRRVGQYLDNVRGLEPDHLVEAARRYMPLDRMTALVYRPESEPPLGWSGTDLSDRLGADAGGGGVSVAARSEDGVTRYDAAGAKLVVKPRRRAPLVSMAIAFPGGVAEEDQAAAGISSLMMRATVRGTQTRSAEQIALASERLGGSIGASAGSDLLSWSLTVPAEHFDQGLELLTDVAFRPSFPEPEVAREREVLLADLERLRDDMYRYPLRLLLSAAFPDHPYGFGPDRIAPAVRELGAAQLLDWHAAQLGEPWVFVVGDIDADQAANAIARRLEQVSGNGRAAGAGRPGVADGGRSPDWPLEPVAREVELDRAQTALALAFPGPMREDPDHEVLEVLSNAVSGLGNRLFEELRSRRSLAYTVTAYPIVRRHAGAFVGYIATSNQRADEARAALLEELLRLREEPPSEEELERARRYTIGTWQIRTQTNSSQLWELVDALMLGGGLTDIHDFQDRIRAVDRERVLEASRRWIQEDRLVQGAVRGTAGAAAGV